MTHMDVATVRREFANRIAALAQLSSELVEALAIVPREDFVGAGPWKVMRPPFTGGYVATPDADPRHLYDTVVVALDASRYLNNGEPSGLALWLDSLGSAAARGFFTSGVVSATTPPLWRMRHRCRGRFLPSKPTRNSPISRSRIWRATRTSK